MIEGIAVQINGSIQDAIDAAGAAYRRKSGMVPSHVCLPADADASALNLYTLQLGPPTRSGRTITRHRGTVLVGRPVDGAGPEQLELFG